MRPIWTLQIESFSEELQKFGTLLDSPESGIQNLDSRSTGESPSLNKINLTLILDKYLKAICSGCRAKQAIWSMISNLLITADRMLDQPHAFGRRLRTLHYTALWAWWSSS